MTVESELAPPAAPAAPAGSGSNRVAVLFRHALRVNDVHPLLPHVQVHHGSAGGLVNPEIGAAPVYSPASPLFRISDETLDKLIGDLPSLPQAVLDAMDLMRDDDSSAADLALCIERDQALTARALRVANSAFFGVSGRVRTVRNAIDLLGRRAVNCLLTSSAVSAQFRNVPGSQFDYAGFWMHAVGTAMAARSLAHELRLDEDAAFTSGLLHDIGRLALVSGCPEANEAALQHAQANDLPPLLAEREVLGTDHAVVGARVATHWRFPPDIVTQIREHHDPKGGANGKPDVVDVIHLADALVHGLDLTAAPHEAVPALDLRVWARLGLQQSQLLPIMASTAACVTELCEALGT